MFKLNAMLLCDFYKVSHRKMYPAGTEYVYSVWIPRDCRIPQADRKVVVFGIHYFIKKWLIDFFNDNFFGRPIEEIIHEYETIMEKCLGEKDADSNHIRDLWELGYLPLKIKSLPEGLIIDIRTPVMTIVNTDPRFFWLTNYIETLASCELWQASTSATIANIFKGIFCKWAVKTGGDINFVPFQGHDFSLRGMSSLDSGIASGMGHLLSFKGTDNIPAILAAKYYYGADESIGASVPASEHSVQCTYQDDYEYMRRLITEIHPTGIVSIVCDGYDFWHVLTDVLPRLKDEILNRDGKVVIRPDSGNPCKIICGDPDADTEHECKGAVELLANLFGTTITPKGYLCLNEKIGLIYGDAITLNNAEAILSILASKNFASTNVVFGIGSYTYQYNTRDTFGWALKSTACTIDGKFHAIYKAPKTDSGVKYSPKGMVDVLYEIGKPIYVKEHLGLDGLKPENLPKDTVSLLQTVFIAGIDLSSTCLSGKTFESLIPASVLDK